MILNKNNMELICKELRLEDFISWSTFNNNDFLSFKNQFINLFDTISGKHQDVFVIVLFLLKDFETLNTLPYESVKKTLMKFNYSNRIFIHSGSNISLNHKYHSIFDEFVFNFLKEADKAEWLSSTFGVLKANNLDFLKIYDHWWDYYNVNVEAKRLRRFFSSKEAFFTHLNRQNFKHKSLKTKSIIKEMVLNVESEFKALIKDDIVAITNAIYILPELFTESERLMYLEYNLLKIKKQVETYESSKGEYLKSYGQVNGKNSNMKPSSVVAYSKNMLKIKKDLHYSLKHKIWEEALITLANEKEGFLIVDVKDSNRMISIGFVVESTDSSYLKPSFINQKLFKMGFSRNNSIKLEEFVDIENRKEELALRLSSKKEIDLKSWENYISSYGVKDFYNLIPFSSKAKLHENFSKRFSSIKNIKESEAEFLSYYFSFSDKDLSLTDDCLNMLKLNFRI